MDSTKDLVKADEGYWVPNWSLLLSGRLNLISTAFSPPGRHSQNFPIVLHSVRGEDVLPKKYDGMKRFPTEELAKKAAVHAILPLQKTLMLVLGDLVDCMRELTKDDTEG